MNYLWQTILLTGQTLLYSGKEIEDDPHEARVEFQNQLLTPHRMGTSVPKVRQSVDPHFHNTTVIQCYAPNNEAQEEETPTFFDMLQPTIDKALRSNMTIAFAGTNSKIGKDNHGREENMKKEVVGLTKKMESSLRSFSFSRNW